MRLGVFVILALALNGCGFHPRGNIALPSSTKSIYLKAPSRALTEEVSLYLAGSGVTITPSKEGADTLLNLSNEQYEKRTLSVDPKTGKEREFEVTYSVDFELRRKDGETLVERQSVTLQRDYIFDPDQVIGKSREESVLRTEMRRDAVQQILRRIETSLSS